MRKAGNQLLAALSAVAAIACFSGAALDFKAGDAAADTLLPARVAVLAVLGLVSLAVAWRFWQSAEAPARETTQLFGRSAGPQQPARPAAGLLLVILPVVAIVAFAADRLILPPPAGQPGTEIANVPAEPPPAIAETPPPESSPPPAASEPAPPAAAEPAPPPAANAPPSPPADLAAPPPDLASPPPAAAETPPAEPQPPEVAAAPPAEPPQTVAPPPPAPPEVETLPQGHRDAVVWLDVSPDGRTLASTSTDHVIKLWDLVEKRFLRDLGTHKDMARTGLFLPGGTELLSAGDEGEVVLRKVDDGTVLHVFSTPDHGGARKLAISADGKRAVSVHEKGTAIVWDLEKRVVLHVIKAHDWPMASVAISSDGTTVLTGDIAGTLKLWDITTGSLKRGWHGHERGTYGAVFTPDGRQLITGSGDFAIKVWDLESGAELRRLDGHFGTVYALALSPDGKLLLSGSLDGTARLWDISTGKELAQMTGHNARVYSVAFGPDGTLITGGDDRAIRVWRPDGSVELAMFAGSADPAPE